MKRSFPVLLLAFLVSAPVFAQQPSVIEQLLAIKPALVEITALKTGWFKRDASSAGLATLQNHGAGVIIDPSGIIVTNAHVIHKADRIQVMFHNRATLHARILRFAPELDLAILKVDVPAALPSILLADSSVIKLNDEVFNVGNSPLLKEALTGGRIIGLASSRNASYSNAYESDLFETTFDLYRGDSGGPLFNRRGQLVGLITAKLLTKSNSSFAVSSNKIARYLEAARNDLQAKK